MIRIGSDTDIGMNRNTSDWLGINSYPILSPGRQLQVGLKKAKQRHLFFKVVVPKIRSLEEKFFYNFTTWNYIIGRILQKKIIFYKINLKLTKNNTFDNVFFLIEFFLIIAQFSKNDWIFINHRLFYQGKYSLQLYCFQF